MSVPVILNFHHQAANTPGNSYMADKGSQSVTAIQNAAQYYYAFNNITWETTTTYDVGVDLVIEQSFDFDGRLLLQENI